MSLDVNTHSSILVDLMRDRVSAVYDAFKTYMTAISTLIGGSVAASLQYGASKVARYSYAADAICLVITLFTVIIIVDNYRSWYDYRLRYSDVAGLHADGSCVVPPPKWKTSFRVHLAMLAVIAIVAVSFVVFNPFRR